MSKFELIAPPVVQIPDGFDARALEQRADGYTTLCLYEMRISTTNRKRFDAEALQQLGANIRDVGILQPILVRPIALTADNPYRYEIIAGERRYRGAVIAELNEVPVIVRTLSDAQAAEIQLLENVQRENPHPLEEAEGYQLLMQNHGYDADQLAEKVKKSRAYIYGRLKLCALANGPREAFLNDQLPASTALLIARIPVPELQQKAMAEILMPPYGPREPMSVRAAAGWLEQRYTLALTNAPFDPKDSKLLTSAGNCTKCPKRTGNQPEIYSDVKSADVCTDPDCYAEKKAAHYKLVEIAAKKKGIPVLEDEESDDVLSHNWDRDAEYVTVDHHLSAFSRVAPATGMSGSVEKHLPAEAMPAPVKYAKDSSGAIKAIYRKEDIQAALEKVGACETESARAERAASGDNDTGLTAQQQRAKEQAKEQEAKTERVKVATLARTTLYRKLRAHFSDKGMHTQLLREIAKSLLRELASPALLLNDLYPNGHGNSQVAEYIDSADAQLCMLIIMDMIFGDCLCVNYWDVDDDDQSENYTALLSLAELEGITASAADLAIAKIDIDALKNPVDVLDMVKANIEYLPEVMRLIIERAPHHLGNLEAAAGQLGYFYRNSQWIKEEAAAAPAARPKLKLKPKTDAPAAPAPAPASADAGPVVTVKKTRSAEVAWPFPTTTTNKA